MNKIRVLLAEDHTLVRAGFRALLEKMDEVAVIGEVSDGREAVRVSKELKPDVVLMDIAMSGMNGLEATSRMCQECPNAKVIMLTMYTNEEYLKEALRAGASGYLLKDADRSELELALKAVCRGKPTSPQPWRNSRWMSIVVRVLPLQGHWGNSRDANGKFSS